MSLSPALTGVVGTLPLPNTTPTPANGEPVRAEDVQMAAQGLLNQDATLAAALGSNLSTFVNQPWFGNGVVLNGSGAFFTVPAGQTGAMMLAIPHKMRVTTIAVKVAPQTHASLPGNMPSVTVYKLNGNTGALVDSWSVTDTSATTVIYNAAHALTITPGTPETIDRTQYVYSIVFTQESGSNAADGDVGQPIITCA